MTSETAAGLSLDVADRLATITLCKPATINAIGPEEIDSITGLLRDAVADPTVGTILIRGEGQRGFCAGGDIKQVHTMIVSGELDRLAAFWAAEYRLDHLIATCPKPVVSIAHGLTLGGGMGLASHASHRVVTDSTRMGMPEVLIGLSPDIGGLWLYSRAPGHTGTFAALTAAHLHAGDALHMGLADHYVPDDRIEELTERLRNLPAATVFGEFTDRPPSWIADHRAAIDRMFGGDSVAGIIESAHATTDTAVAEAALSALTSASPTALCVTHEALRRAARMRDLAECLEQDLRVGQHCSRHPDLTEGIRARVVDKDRRPKWSPPTVAEVSATEVSSFFEPIGPRLQFGTW
ncbi:enoyl-CoA hydratase/isomerase family protein [Mycobacterium sp. 21AC1]|uniref:enoyl-CoA hydratase/isomerase family protein n=1 Tax=[Mycobacterium] appelbergii TaxID=2939269 RepID=UPI002938DBC5|nr:enoyl-CoA hydratase/isomerase family protein [Mycobacterium sp. 21AC1]MDV3125358.1 enoyl-CoA hydratase/isomerase family protein [Mycobacterium sp. 21AC1]